MKKEYVVISRIPTGAPDINSEVAGQEEIKITFHYPVGEEQLKEVVHNTMRELEFNNQTPDLEQKLQDILDIVEVGQNINAYWYAEDFEEETE